MDRRIFNHPIRKCTTEAMYSEPIDIIDFKEIIVNSFDAFYENMEDSRKTDNIYLLERKYIEEWVEQYLAWLEIEEER